MRQWTQDLREASDVLGLFPLTGVAPMRALAEAIGVSPHEFAALWNDLPLDDATIAARLGITRQQVINLRKWRARAADATTEGGRRLIGEPSSPGSPTPVPLVDCR